MLLLLSACGGGSGVKPEPRRPAPVAAGDDAPRSKYGNPESYEVYGETYHVLPSARGYSERGMASWYGEDFHGKRTSSGEPYNMHAMTAAHKTLPLPSYVRVTNLRNRREVIVRVNDRGPFHDDRLIDLSFAAATELGVVRNGTAEVEVTAVDPVVAAAGTQPRSNTAASPPPARTEPRVTPAATRPRTSGEAASDVLAPDEIPVTARGGSPGDTNPIIEELPQDETTLPAPSTTPSTRTAAASGRTVQPAPIRGHYLQAGAFSEPKNADALAERLRKAGFETVGVYPTRGILKVRLGPYPSPAAMQGDDARLREIGIRAYRVEE
ncbi:MAG: septal ring lytic transglycosylase RlpA family protein [Nevskiales bacterium]